MNKPSKDIIKSIRNVVRNKKARLHEPIFLGNEKKYLSDCIDSGFVSTAGKYIKKFERLLSIYTKSKYVVAVNSGTSALQIAILVSGIKENNEILMPALTFVATPAAAIYNNCVPHFIDSDIKDLSIDIQKLKEYLNKISVKKNGKLINIKTNREIKGIIPVHTFGHIGKITELKKLAREFNLIVIEDAAEALGSFYKGKHAGTFGEVGILSFNGNKIVTTGAGGAILTNSKKISERARHLAATAKKKHMWEYDHDFVGFNYRMSNINAALGLAQLEKIPYFLLQKRKLYKKYKKIFKNNLYVNLLGEPIDCSSNYWFQTIFLKDKFIKQKNNILLNLNNSGYQCRPAWKLMSELKPYKNFPKMNLSNSKQLYKKIINIPSSSNL